MAWRITNKGRLDSVNFRYEVTITVDQDGGHHPNPAEFAVAALTLDCQQNSEGAERPM